jgi:hypothetical protein
MGKKKPEEMAKQREILLKERRIPIILRKRRLMKYSVFWKSLPDMDLINHTPLLTE